MYIAISQETDQTLFDLNLAVVLTTVGGLMLWGAYLIGATDVEGAKILSAMVFFLAFTAFLLAFVAVCEVNGYSNETVGIGTLVWLGATGGMLGTLFLRPLFG